MIRRLSQAVLAAGFALIAHAGLALADDAMDAALTERDAATFITTLTDALVAEVVAHPDDERARISALTDVLESELAVARIGRFILPPSAREGASEADITRYEALVPRYIAATFAGQIDALASQTVVLDDTVMLKPGEALVRSRLISTSGRKAANVDWRVATNAAGAPVLLDTLVNRTSPMVAQRSVAMEVAACSGLPALLGYMAAVAEDAERPDVRC